MLEQRYQMSPIEHAPTETNGSIAAPDTNGRYVVYTSTQALFFSLDTCAKILDVPSNTFHFIGGTVGGGFGGKVDTLTEPLCHPRRDADRAPGALRVRARGGDAVRSAARRRAHLHQGRRDARRPHRRAQDPRLFRQRRLYRLSSYAAVKCAAHLPGPYTIPNVYGDVYCVFTNRTPATAMRGFGVTAMDFAIECQMDKLAHLVGMDPMEFRILNAYRDGDMKAHRREAKNTALIECVQVAAEKAKWPIREEFRRMSSRKDGGGSRAAVPPTPREHARTPSPRPSSARHTIARPRPRASRRPRRRQLRPLLRGHQAPSHGATRFSSVFGTRRR